MHRQFVTTDRENACFFGSRSARALVCVSFCVAFPPGSGGDLNFFTYPLKMLGLISHLICLPPRNTLQIFTPVLSNRLVVFGCWSLRFKPGFQNGRSRPNFEELILTFDGDYISP